MPSSYSPNLRIELIASGEQANTWGNTTNNNLGTLIEQAIAGLISVDVSSLSVTLTALDGLTDQSRNMILEFTGTPATTATVYAPNGATKVYIAYNTTAYNVVLAVAGSSGSTVSVPPSTAYLVFCDGTNIVKVSV